MCTRALWADANGDVLVGRNMVWVELDQLDFTAGAPSRRLDVTGVEWLVGDVSVMFTECPTLQFLPATPAAQPAR